MSRQIRKILSTTVFGLFGATLLAPAAELIPSTGMTAIAGDAFDAVRAPGRVLNGLTDGGGLPADGSIFLAGAFDPNNPADYRNDASQGSNGTVGQRVGWSETRGGNNWIRVDLGADYTLDTMASCNLTVSSASFNGSNEFEVVVEGLILGRTYNLQRDPDLSSDFTTTVESIVAGSNTETLTDGTPLPGKAFYRVED